MATIVFDPDQIGSNSSNIVLNDSDITSNYSEASDAASDAVLASNAASDAVDDASDAVIDASEASVAASSAASDVAVVEADDRYAKSVYSDPATDSFAVTQIDVASDSKIYLSHSDDAVT